MTLRTLLALTTGLLAMTACADGPRADASHPHSRPGNFPVVEPFALEQAGSRLTVDFELPEAPRNGGPRPVFIGFRAVNATSDGSDEMLRNSVQLTEYLHESALPVRIRLRRIAGAHEDPVLLYDIHRNIADLETRYEPHPGEIFTNHPAASTDNTPLIDAGLFRDDEVYYVHQFAQIVPQPGTYRVEVESLESHPVLEQLKRKLPKLRYELLVSHYYPR